jgi:AcrR family transcriptional regulator
MQTRPPASSSPKGVARRRLIIETATRLIARNGSRGTTLAQIAHESGVSQPGLIYYFATKDELLNAALDERDGVEEAALWPVDGEGLNFLETIVASVDAWQASPDAVGMHTVLVAENVGQDGTLRPRLTERYTATVERFAALLVEAQKQGAVRREVDVRNKAREIIAFINGLETAWLLNPDIPAGTIAAQWAADQRRALAP